MEADKAYLMVRAQVADESDRAKFDHWYGTHHVPMAMDRFRCEKGWPGFKELVADFDQAWPNVPRTRDMIEAVQEA